MIQETGTADKAELEQLSNTITEIDALGTRKDLVLTPLMHDTPQELGQPFDPRDWKLGECDPIPGKTMPAMTVVERNYRDIYKKFTSIGLAGKSGQWR